MVEFGRPYTPDLLGFLSKFAEVSAYYDANGHYARVSTADANWFHYCKPGDTNAVCTGGGGPYTTGQLAPIPSGQQFNGLTFGTFTRCPGGSTQPIAGSNPFTDDGNLLSGGMAPNPKCRPPTCLRDHEADRRDIALLAAASLVLFGQAASGWAAAATRSGRSSTTGASWSPVSRCGSREPTSGASTRWTHGPGRLGEPIVSRDAKSSTCDDPGKAVVVMKITNAGFQDFRQDASCLIRPQSLPRREVRRLRCRPSPGRPAPSTTAAGGPPGRPAGRRPHFLPLENNGQEVDLDLVNNIMRQPYADRFRLILNDLGAGLAARGNTLDAIIKRADPALQQTDRVLAVLARRTISSLGSPRTPTPILTPLARERTHLAGFINNANTRRPATAERSADLESGLQKFPAVLHELRLTMTKLRGFSKQATPVFSEFRTGAPAIARATRRSARSPMRRRRR